MRENFEYCVSFLFYFPLVILGTLLMFLVSLTIKFEDDINTFEKLKLAYEFMVDEMMYDNNSVASNGLSGLIWICLIFLIAKTI